MADTQASIQDYTTGTPRKHHDLHLEDGTFVMQVENAIFKIHRSVVAMYSPVIKDMLEAPNESGHLDGTDESPLVLTGDNVTGWEVLLRLQYDSPRIKPERLSGEQLLLILPIAHKYCMERIEADTIEELKKTSSDDGFVDLIVAARIVDSEELCQDGIRRMISSGSSPKRHQSKRMGVDATHAVMTAVIATLNRTHAQAMAATRLETICQVAAIRREMAAAAAEVDKKKCKSCQRRKTQQIQTPVDV